LKIDAVVVTYNSAKTIRTCVESLLAAGTDVTIVDNASRDATLDVLGGLPVHVLPQDENHGFAFGCNVGIAATHGDYVLLLNPDAVVEDDCVRRLAGCLAADPAVGLAAPRIVDRDGSLEFSQRRFPRLRSTFAVALFAHRLFPRATWQDELIRDPAAYARRADPPWVSGACMLVPREVCDALNGLDDGFFLYGEDVDFCKRIRDAGWTIRFEPNAVVRHLGGSSAPRAELLPLLAASRLRYSRKHESRATRAATRLGVAVGAATHMLLARGGRRRGHARALLVAIAPGKLDDRYATARRALGKSTLGVT